MMIPAESGALVAALIGAAALVFFFLGFFLGRRLAKRASGENPGPVEIDAEDEEQDDPTAPIAPMIEMARSPHDRHRDLAVGKALVRQIDFLESMLKTATRKDDPDTARQLEILREEFTSLLGECSVEAFAFPAGTVIDSEIRKRIKIVGGETQGERSVVAETLQCGYLYLHGEEDTMILRKAEIKIG